MKLQLYLSPELSDKMASEASQKGMEIRELAIQKLNECYKIVDTGNDYQAVLANVKRELEEFVLNSTVETFSLIDLTSFKEIYRSSLRAAVGRGIAKYVKDNKQGIIDYLRDEKGQICRDTYSHSAIYKVLAKGE